MVLNNPVDSGRQCVGRSSRMLCFVLVLQVCLFVRDRWATHFSAFNIAAGIGSGTGFWLELKLRCLCPINSINLGKNFLFNMDILYLCISVTFGCHKFASKLVEYTLELVAKC